MSSPVPVIILAAGESARMGRPKQLLVYQGQTLIRRAAETAMAANIGPVVVVLGANEEAIRNELADLPVTFVLNHDWSEGMASSIRVGLQAVPEADAVVFMLCDQPLVTGEILNLLVSRYRIERKPIVACEYGDGLGVPVLFDRSLFDELSALNGAQGAKKVVMAHRAEASTVPFSGGDVDVDTPEQYARLIGE